LLKACYAKEKVFTRKYFLLIRNVSIWMVMMDTDAISMILIKRKLLSVKENTGEEVL